ncbi:type IV toxin-antitoxin system AbiEi family antitoxin domain-containing protein [Cellulomonas sp. Marseille-Q8402]
MDVLRTIARAPSRTVHPADLTAHYVNPRAGLRDLARRGVVHRLAHGTYCLVPPDADPTSWRPSLEAAAVAVARTPAQASEPVLTGLSAARVHHALPRALSTAWVSVTTARRPVRLADRPADVRFVRRAVDDLAAERVLLDLGAVLVTTPEQTLLDLARPGSDEPETREVLRALWPRADEEELEHLARRTRSVATLARIQRAVR